MGAWSDRSNPRYFMPAGLLLTALCNFAFGATSSYPTHLALWTLNGLVQGMGWGPCGRSLGHWYSVRERGTVFAFWNIAHNVGGGLTGLIAAYSTAWMGWRSAFYVPGVLAVLCACYLMVRLRDTPQSVGLPPVEEYRHDYPPEGGRDREEELGTRELLMTYVLKNRALWLFAAANFFVYIARYSMLDWGPTYLKEVKRASLQDGGFSTAIFEFAGIFSTILMGWLSDKSRRTPRHDQPALHGPRVPGIRRDSVHAAGNAVAGSDAVRRGGILHLSAGDAAGRHRAGLQLQESRWSGGGLHRTLWISRPHRAGQGARHHGGTLRLGCRAVRDSGFHDSWGSCCYP